VIPLLPFVLAQNNKKCARCLVLCIILNIFANKNKGINEDIRVFRKVQEWLSLGQPPGYGCGGGIVARGCEVRP
jgi:hypothetical protein